MPWEAVAAIAAAIAAVPIVGAILRTTIVNALSPQLAEVNKRIDEHMTLEEAELQRQSGLQGQTATSLAALAATVAQLHAKFDGMDNRITSNAVDIAYLRGVRAGKGTT